MQKLRKLAINWSVVIFKQTFGRWSAAYSYGQKFYHFIKVMDPAFRLKLLIAHAISIFANLVFLVGSLAIVPFVNYVINPDSINNIGFMSKIYDFATEHIPVDFVIVLGVFSLIAMIAARLFSVLGSYISQVIHKDLRIYYTTKLYYSYINGIYHSADESTAEIVNNINTRLPQIIANFINPIFSLINIVIFVSSGLLILFFLNPVLLMLAGLGGGALLFGSMAASRKRARQYSTIMDEGHAERHKKLLNSISAREYIQMIGKQNLFAKNYALVQDKIGKSEIKMALINMLFGPIGEFIVYGTMVVLAIYIFTIAGQDQLEVATAFLIIIYRLLPYLNQAFAVYIGLQQGIVAYNQVSGKLLKAMATPVSYEGHVRDPLPFNKSIGVKNASYSYPTQAKGELALRKINLNIAKGSVVGVCGVSGGGKTTLLRLITARIAADKGSFAVDGKKIIGKKLVRRWQDAIGYVTQNLILVEGTMAENITLDFDGDIDDARLQQAIDIAELRTLVNSMPEKEHSSISDSGANISGGQRQRIVIARALYLNPDLLILDEATSSLDKRTESKILQNIYDYYEQREFKGTLIIVSHRVDALKNCDSIIMVEDGSIAAQGKYKDLLKLASFRSLAQTD